MNLIHDIPAKSGNGFYHMIVENPCGVSEKYEVNKKYGIIGLDRHLKAPMPFPFEYGFIPGTWNKSDGDPVDVMALLPNPTFVGCLLTVRLIGMYRMIDTGEEDYKILALCANDMMFNHVKDLEDLSVLYKKRIKFFWENYKNLTPRKNTKGLGWSSKEKAERYVKKSVNYYKVKFGNSSK